MSSTQYIVTGQAEKHDSVTSAMTFALRAIMKETGHSDLVDFLSSGQQWLSLTASDWDGKVLGIATVANSEAE